MPRQTNRLYLQPSGARRRRAGWSLRDLWPVLAGLLLVVAGTLIVIFVVLAPSSRPREVTESMFQDDQYLLYSPTATVNKTLDTLQSLGVDRVRVEVLWAVIAPGTNSRTRPPGFDAANPGAYVQQAWFPFDRLVELAKAHRIGVNFDLTAPGPLWAMARPAPDPRAAAHYRASPGDFAQFVAAVGKRYSGSYSPPQIAGGLARPLPRVDYWSIWNEPNQPGWLAPQWRTVSGERVMDSPRLYREYVDAAFSSLKRTGHSPGTDTVLVGDLAPEGSEGPGNNSLGCTQSSGICAPIPPLSFLRTLYCVGPDYRPLRGPLTGPLHCPTSGSAAAFIAEHPGLFHATGFAHHPYSFFLPPATPVPDPNYVPLSDLTRLELALDRIFASYGLVRQMPIYLTEYGYETNPPNPFRGVSPARQALYLDQAQYMAWRDPRVRTLSQFLLYDSPPDRRYPRGSAGYWSTFQTGLLYLNGAPKPSLAAYRLPIFVPDAVFKPGAPLLIWGMLRAAPHGATDHAQVQWRGPQGGYRTLATVSTSDPSGYLTIRLSLPGTGSVRIAWSAPNGQVFRSRAAAVRAR